MVYYILHYHCYFIHIFISYSYMIFLIGILYIILVYFRDNAILIPCIHIHSSIDVFSISVISYITHTYYTSYYIAVCQKYILYCIGIFNFYLYISYSILIFNPPKTVTIANSYLMYCSNRFLTLFRYNNVYWYSLYPIGICYK